MKYNDIYNAVKEEFNHDVALLTVQMLTIHMSTKIKDPFKFHDKIVSKISKTLAGTDPVVFDIAMKCWEVCYEWETRQSLTGFGGCVKKTFKELIQEKIDKKT